MASTISAGTTSGTAIAIAGDTSGQLQLQTNGTTTAVTITTAQNVGIGTTTPAQPLEISSATGGTLGLRYISNSGYASIGTDANNNILFSIGNPPTEKARIDSSGNLLVGSTSVIANSKTGILFDGSVINGLAIKSSVVNSNTNVFVVFKNSADSTAGVIQQNGLTSVAYTTSSDYRLKDNVVPMTSALNTILQLNPVTYKWKADGSDGQGFIAHELQTVVPDCVIGKKDAVDAEGNPIYQSIDTSFLIATLTAAIQELNAKVNAQAAEIQALKGNS